MTGKWHHSSEASLRERLPRTPQHEQGFRWRGDDVSRVEGFTDAVFAFAVTLLVVALEVPRSFDGLMDVVRSMPAFVICFALLMTFWNAHYRYHRRYGLEDVFTRVMTMAIIVLVLFYVYPLKFLFLMVTVNLFGLAMHDPPHLDAASQVETLYLIYGLGLGGIWTLYALLYVHALRKREQLQLTPVEIVMTKGALAENLVYVAVCAVSILCATLTKTDSLPGLIYVSLGPLQALTGWWFGRKAKALAAKS